MFNGIEVRAIRGEKSEAVSVRFDGVLRVLPLMESGVIHHNHGFLRQYGEQLLGDPGMKGRAVHACIA